MFKKLIALSILLFAVLACEKEETPETNRANTSVSEEQIIGTWYFKSGNKDGQGIRQLYQEHAQCGYNHIGFYENGDYLDVVFTDRYCSTQTILGKWELNNGVINVVLQNGQKVDYTVLGYVNSILMLNTTLDLKNDGNLTDFDAYMSPYDGLSKNLVTSTFVRDDEEKSLIKFDWEASKDAKVFNRYEIYRSAEGICDKEGATLIKAITDRSITTFTDLNPPATTEKLCYFLKLFYGDVLVGESSIQTVDPTKIEILNSIVLKTPTLKNGNISLEWEECKIPYFSHYEVVYGTTSYFQTYKHDEYNHNSILDIDALSYLELDPPYYPNPYCTIDVYNKFGNKIRSNSEQVQFERKGLFGPMSLTHLEIDDESPVVYWFSSDVINGEYNKSPSTISRVNYKEEIVESKTTEGFYVYSNYPFRMPFDFSGGRSMILNNSSELTFVDPVTLEKNFAFGSLYTRNELGLSRAADFNYTDNGFIVIIDSEEVFVFRKEGDVLRFKDKMVHFGEHYGNPYFKIEVLKNNQILIGQINENECVSFVVDDKGKLQDKKRVPFGLNNYGKAFEFDSFYSESGNKIIHYGGQEVFSTESFSQIARLPSDLYAIGMNKSGNTIFATKHGSDIFDTHGSYREFKRELVLFDANTEQTQTIKTKGYPIRVFENHLGEVYSISILKRNDYYNLEVFFEKIK